MFCPQCGQQQVSEETRFCSRCGFPLVGVADLVARGGAIPSNDQTISPRKRGLKHGLFIFLLTFLVVPIVGMICMALRIPPFPVGMTAVLLFMGGMLRMVYALMFESANPGGSTLEEHILEAKQKILSKPEFQALPPQRSVPVSDYISPASGNWRDTSDLLTPGTVTENTTRLLEKNQ